MRETWFDPWVRKIPWRREQLPIPVFWPGRFHGLYHELAESDMTERPSLSLFFFFLLYLTRVLGLTLNIGLLQGSLEWQWSGLLYELIGESLNTIVMKFFFSWQLHAIRIVASQLGNSVQGRLVNKMGSHSRSVQGMALKLQWFNDDSIWVLIRSSGFVWFIWAILLGYAIITTTIIITIPFCKLQVKKLMCIKKLIFFFFSESDH